MTFDFDFGFVAMLFTGIFLAGLLTLAVSKPLVRRDLVVHQLNAVPSGWMRLGAAPPKHEIRLRIILEPADSGALDHKVNDTSHPASSNFRNHLNKTEVRVAEPAARSSCVS